MALGIWLVAYRLLQRQRVLFGNVLAIMLSDSYTMSYMSPQLVQTPPVCPLHASTCTQAKTIVNACEQLSGALIRYCHYWYCRGLPLFTHGRLNSIAMGIRSTHSQRWPAPSFCRMTRSHDRLQWAVYNIRLYNIRVLFSSVSYHLYSSSCKMPSMISLIICKPFFRLCTQVVYVYKRIFSDFTIETKPECINFL